MFSSFYDNAPVVEIEGRMFPVDLNYIPAGRDGMLDATHVVAAVAEAAVTIHQHFTDPSDGDVLRFLPGQDDVLRAKQHFEKIIAKNAKQAGTLDSVVAHALYGKQDPDEQAEVLKKYTGAASQRKRKMIFSTNIAETSVTIDGVAFVVDSGLMKGVVYDPIRNMTSLKAHAISRSSAIQRMGRAGRTQPGKCFRLYSIRDYNEMEVGSVAEIFQQPLSLALLTLHHIGIDPRHFAWIQSPNDAAMAQAEEELTFLGAIDASKQLTDLGKLIADVQLDPRVVRMIDCGSRRGLGCVATDLAAVMSVAHIFFWSGGNDKKAKAEAAKKKAQFLTSDGDIVSMYHAYCEWETVLNTGTMNESNDGSGNETGTVEEEDDKDPEEAATAAMGAALKRTVALVRRNSDLWKQGQEEEEEEEEENKDNNDDDDTSSVCSEEPSPVKQRAPKAKNVFDLRRIAAKWCVKNSLNGKALGIALAFAKELRGIFRKTAGWKIGGNDSKADDAVDGESIRRLITAGYFMNVARLKPVSRFGLQYYALFSGVTGSLHFGSALNPDRNV
ncbi:putative pre-mRNA-splicing factor ATP-dependent RNA helicase PRP1 [Phytophthora citrophthora]|uniref:Pre-mRNA-splicing factor ATP-dependent RNA helicase PRP1 n=1 Tax=Phytophthora citrophthora TaxID=4793 RepID=A0AAD9GNZ1_9STRA|nr:putative pre-mRNA-splicing factor ATP-dependent RNA helicase PRP1 [Phytophthora citrophthora]